MKYLLLIFSFFFSVSFITNTTAQTLGGNGGIVYGSDHAFSLVAPKGWVLDNSAGVNQGVYAVFYPVGESWKDALTVMYANASTLLSKQTIEEYIKSDLDEVIKAKPDVDIKKLPDYKLVNDKNKSALVRVINGDSFGNYEAIAYTQEDSVIVQIVISAKGKQEYDHKINKFYELLDTYSFITHAIKIDEK